MTLLVKYSLCERELKWVYRWASAPSVVGTAAVIQHQLVSLTLVYVTFSLCNHICCLIAVVANLSPTWWQLGGTMTCLHSSSTEGKGGDVKWIVPVLIGRASCWPEVAVGWFQGLQWVGYIKIWLSVAAVCWHFSDYCRGRNRTEEPMLKLWWKSCWGLYVKCSENIATFLGLLHHLLRSIYFYFYTTVK